MTLEHIESALEANTWPDIRQEDVDAVTQVLNSRFLYSGKGGPQSNLLEKRWAEYCQVSPENVLAVSSCTAALHLALTTLGVGPGDEVITTALTFSGTTHPICYTSAKPVFVDVHPRTFNIDPSCISNAITNRTKAILPVHLHGLMADMIKIQKIAEQHNLLVIEDACQAHGASIKGRVAGTWGNAGCFSLSESKSLMGGQGGFIIFNDAKHANIARALRNYGEKPIKDGDRDYTSFDIGFNYVLPEIPAALAASQLNRLNNYISQAIENSAIISKILSKIPGISVPTVPKSYVHIFHKYRVLFEPSIWFSKRLGPTKSREILLRELRLKNVPATTWQLTPVSSYPVFEFLNNNTAIVAQKILNNSIILGDERHPLAVQNKEVVASWARIIEEIYETLPFLYDD